VYTAPRSPQPIGGVIDSAINLFKASFRQCWLATVLYCLAGLGLAIWLQTQVGTEMRAQLGEIRAAGGTPEAIGLLRETFSSPAIWGTYLVMLLLSLLFNLMITWTMVDTANGRSDGSGALSRFNPSLLLLPGAVGVTLVVGVALCIGFVLLLVPGFYMLVRWALWSAAYTDRREGAFAALGTSWNLVGSNWWRTATVPSVVGLVAFILAAVLSAVAGLIGAATGQDAATRLIISQVVESFAQVFYVPALTAAVVAVYQDLKLRKGGADLEARLGGLGASRP
jgi:hypothetical protein